jgi:hypothetical protein
MEEKESKELLELTRENNKMLHSMIRSARVSRFFRMVYWAFIIGSFIGTYYYLQPYIDQLMQIYGQVSSTLKDVGAVK